MEGYNNSQQHYRSQCQPNNTIYSETWVNKWTIQLGLQPDKKMLHRDIVFSEQRKTFMQRTKTQHIKWYTRFVCGLIENDFDWAIHPFSWWLVIFFVIDSIHENINFICFIWFGKCVGNFFQM